MKKGMVRYVLAGVLLCVLLLALPVQAAPRKHVWVTKKEKVYYYGAKGKRVTGLREIKEKQYFFDAKGVQRTGWRKIKNDYYFFKIGKRKKGYMLKNQTINGIRLSKNGKAVVNASNLRKLKLMTEANRIVDAITAPGMTKMEKLKKCFDYTSQTYGYQTWRSFSAAADWDQVYAEDMFYRGRGNCFSYAAAFAYLANALGYKASVVSSGGHGWAEIGGRVFDPDWVLVSQADTYFNMSYDLSGVNGRPNYKNNRAYIITI